MPGGLLGPAPIRGGLLGEPRRDRLAREMTHQANTRPQMGLLDALALATSPVPVVGDLTGLAADARMYAQEPQSRTWGNFAMTAAGALPFVPGAVAGTLRTANKVTDAMPGNQIPNNYRGGHTAPTRAEGARLDDLTLSGVYPSDIYSRNGASFYGHGDPALDNATMRVVNTMRGKPDAPVTIYRAVPKDAPDEISPGDWVTINKDYAQRHGAGPLGGEYKIITRKVRAKDVATNGDSFHEWGYDPAD